MAALRPIAFVLPWYGPDVPGGAEQNARHLAEHLCAAGVPVEVWTTCARRLGSNWNQDYHPPGRTIINHVPVTRFRVTPVERGRYWAVHRRLARGRRITFEEESLFLTLSIRSSALVDHIRTHPYHICTFTPYVFGTTYWGAYAAPDRSYLIPCLHDEGFARLAALGELFRSVRGVLCNSPAEMRLVKRLHGVPRERMALIGGGITLENRGNAQAFRDRFAVSSPYVLCVGRKSPGKNTQLLLTYFDRYLRRRKTQLKLVLLGGGRVFVPPSCRHAVIDLGYVSEQEKHNAFAAATLFCQPSINESFSLVLMEAWVQRIAALVNARCEVTREHCQLGQGGLYFNGYAEFEATLDVLLSDAALRNRMGARGRRYVEQNYTWEQVIDRFLEAVYA